jgi:histo-blood group ABO system transferase
MGAKSPQRKEVDFSKLNFPRLAHNYLQKIADGDYSLDNLNLLNSYVNYLFEQKDLPKYKVGLMFVCINEPYWQYAEPVIQGVKNLFLPGHDVEIMCWSDMDKDLGITTFPTESVEWPYPTLMRYHLFLGQEEYLKKFDYLFYLDLDMRLVNIVGDEILGDGLTMAQHPMYATQQPFWYPYEPNEKSAAYIKQPGRVLETDGKKMFQPLYAAGGFQGGPTPLFMDAMKAMKKSIDKDLDNSYVARWNDESHWNKYLYENPPSVVLNPSYVYPDSMIDEYYVKLWGRNYSPKIITLTKPFTTSKEGGAAAAEMIRRL